MANENSIKGKPGPGNEYQSGTPPTSIPPAGSSTVSNGLNATTQRYDVFRNGVRIAVARTLTHANELSSSAAMNWPNPNAFTLANTVTSYQAPAGM